MTTTLTFAERQHLAAFRTQIAALATTRRLAPDTILVRYEALPVPTVCITLLAFACCYPTIRIVKPILAITPEDIAEAVAPVLRHRH